MTQVIASSLSQTTFRETIIMRESVRSSAVPGRSASSPRTPPRTPPRDRTAGAPPSSVVPALVCARPAMTAAAAVDRIVTESMTRERLDLSAWLQQNPGIFRSLGDESASSLTARFDAAITRRRVDTNVGASGLAVMVENEIVAERRETTRRDAATRIDGVIDAVRRILRSGPAVAHLSGSVRAPSDVGRAQNLAIAVAAGEGSLAELHDLRAAIDGTQWDEEAFPETTRRTLCRLGYSGAEGTLGASGLDGRWAAAVAEVGSEIAHVGVLAYEVCELLGPALPAASIARGGSIASGIALLFVGSAVAREVHDIEEGRRQLARTLGL